MSQRLCRFCGAPLTLTFADLGMSPPSNTYLERAQLGCMEKFYPLHARVCEACFLVQLDAFETPEEIFSDYAYFSSYSESWLAHARKYVAMMCARFGLGPQSKVIEIASNDGYLLQYFAAQGVPVLGIEPAANVAREAEKKGVTTLVKFFGMQTAAEMVRQGTRADVLIGNNVLAHAPDLNDFVAGMKILLAPQGVATMEFPHLLKLIQDNQFDTIYHEHFSYFSFLTVQNVFAKHGIELFDVEEIPTHGGSLRIFGQHAQSGEKAISTRVADLIGRERGAGLYRADTYLVFDERVREAKRRLLEFLIGAKRAGKRIVGYGAPAKGNTLLNYCGIRSDFVDYTVDRSPHKQGRFLPGVHLPIHAPERIFETRPDYVLILPWNLKDEIVEQMKGIRAWGGRFVVPIPEVRVLD